jgi:enoyl-CoA hydratase/carnithine racemase
MTEAPYAQHARTEHVRTAPDAADGELTTLAIDDLADGVAALRIDRPDRMNAQTVRMFAEFGIGARILRERIDAGEVRAVVLTASGERAFSAGFDLSEIDVIQSMGARDFLQFQETATEGIQSIRALPVPVVAAIHGAAVGGGLALALAADIRLVSPTAKFSAAFIKMGLSIGELGTSFNLTRLVGPAKTAEFGYTGRMIDADEALSTGLANHVVPTEALLDEAVRMARTIAERDPHEIRLSKALVQRATEIPSFSAVLEMERMAQALASAAAR